VAYGDLQAALWSLTSLQVRAFVYYGFKKGYCRPDERIYLSISDQIEAL